MLTRFGVFAAGVVSASVVCVLAAEVWIHFVEHNAYRNGVR
jgi:hypothetical protein